MASPIGLGDLVSAIQTAISLYNSYTDLSEKIASTITHLEKLKDWVERLNGFCKKWSRQLAEIPASKKQLIKAKKDIQTTIEDLIQLLESRDASQTALGTFNRVVWWARSGNAQLEKLNARIDEQAGWIDRWMAFVSHQTNQTNAVMLKQLKANASSQAKLPSVLVVDNYDTGRSVVLAYYCKLMKRYAERNGATWPLGNVQSAGVRVKGTGKMLAAQEEMNLANRQAGGKPLSWATESLFDNGFFKEMPEKSIFRKQMQEYTARCLPLDYFNYQYIILFDGFGRRGFNRLSNALETAGTAKPIKGQVIMLGSYNQSGDVNIGSPRYGKENSKSRKNWDKTAALIKLSLRSFLELELGFVRPRKKADTQQ